jgi:serine/threonine protein kinase/tetratricopeptide (TPR) repeat protein
VEQIGKYKIIGKIGQGAMGEVWQGHDPILNRDVAIKTISASLGSDSDLLQRFRREAQSAARLNHQNIITVYDFGEEQGKLYMAMELLGGSDLKDAIGHQTLANLDQKLDLMEQICSGLAFAHSKDVIHRDLKPANIHIQPDGQVKIMDFGLARIGGSEMTRTGVVMGTPNYMSPEQVRGEKADARSDVFSTGAVFYEVLTDQKPFVAETMHAVLFQVLQSEPPSLREVAPDTPGILVEMVEKALNKDAKQRFRSGGELLEAVRTVRRVLAEGRGDETTLEAEMGPMDVESTMIERPPTRSSTSPGSGSRIAGPGSTRSSGLGSSRSGSGSRPKIDGATALAMAQPTVMSGTRTPTVRGAGATQRGESTLEAPPSRMPLYAGAGVVVLLAGGFGAYWLTRKPAGPSADSVALTQALAVSQLQLAQKNLADRDYQAAMTQADGVLKMDPANVDAKKVQEQAQQMIRDADAAAADGRSALEAGDGDRAAKALSKLLSLNPKHPAAADLSEKLNSRFRAQAEEAQRGLRQAQAEADKSKASSESAYADAASLAREADGLFGKGEYAVAARKFLEGRDGFERARRAAQQKASQTPPPATAPPATQVAVSLPPVTTPRPTVPTATLLPTPPPPPATTVVLNEEPAIRRVVADYKRAIEQRDLALFKTVKPNISGDEEKKLRTAFENIKSQEVSLQIVSVQVDGPQATVRLTRRDTINGKSYDSIQQTFGMVKVEGNWTIRQIGQ